MSTNDRLLSSLFLDISLKEIDAERCRMRRITKGDVSTKTVKKIEAKVIVYTDNTFFSSADRLDFKTFCILYLLKNTLYSNINIYIEKMNNVLTNVQYMQTLKNKFLSDIREVSLNNKLLDYLNVVRLGKEFTRLKIKNSIFNNKLLVEFSGVTLEGEPNMTPVVVHYNRVIVFIVDWEIEGFMLRFDHFDYNSYWGLDLMLHPKLMLPHGWNGLLQWTKGDYPLYADTLREIICEYNPKLRTLENEVQPLYIRLRQLWAGLKYTYKNRVDLSKEIFSRIDKEIKLKTIKTKDADI
jgi:hypothetical protein